MFAFSAPSDATHRVAPKGMGAGAIAGIVAGGVLLVVGTVLLLTMYSQKSRAVPYPGHRTFENPVSAYVNAEAEPVDSEA